jgi:Transglutaminase-like superfamily
MRPAKVEVIGVQPLSRLDKARLGVEILLAYVRVRWLLFRRDLPSVLAALRSHPAAPLSGEEARLASLTGLRLGNAVTKTLRRLPTDSRCLAQSLVLTCLLARRGIDSSLVIGVCPQGAELKAHAWLEREEIELLPGEAGYQRLLEA